MWSLRFIYVTAILLTVLFLRLFYDSVSKLSSYSLPLKNLILDGIPYKSYNQDHTPAQDQEPIGEGSDSPDTHRNINDSESDKSDSDSDDDQSDQDLDSNAEFEMKQ